MKVGVLGLWHLGTVTSACLASLGLDVIAVDPNPKVVNDLKNGVPPIFEPRLEGLVRSGIQKKLITFTGQNSSSFESIEFLWVCIDTPIDDEDNANTEEVMAELKKALPYLPDNCRIIISSQLPVGAISALEGYCKSRFSSKNFIFACSPENLRLGNAVSIFLNPDRIIVGIRKEADKTKFSEIFSLISKNLVWMSIESAEMTKHAINAFLANSVVFANEIAAICECVGADAKEVEMGLKTETRIGPKAYLSPGGAFSGGTLARDVQYLEKISSANQLSSPLITSILSSNNNHKSWVRNKLINVFGDLNQKNITLWGLAYKAGTDTLRRSEAVELGEWLMASGANLNIFDPLIKNLPVSWGGKCRLHKNVGDSLKDCDGLILGSNFKNIAIDIIALQNIVSHKIVVIDPSRDFIDLFDGANVKYFSVGLSRKISKS